MKSERNLKQNYKLILQSSKVYREITLSPEVGKVTIGTGVGSDVRFQTADFFAPFQIAVIFENSVWSVICDTSVYISAGDVRRLVMSELTIDTPVSLRYRESDTDVLEISLEYDFGDRKSYDLFLDLTTVPLLRISASSNADIRTGSTLTTEDSIVLNKQNGVWVLTVLSDGCGTAVNGSKVNESIILRERDFIDIGPYSFCLADGGLYTSKTTDLTVRGISEIDRSESKTNLVYPNFNRGTRVQGKLQAKKIEVLDPPAMPPESNKDIVTQLLPSVAMMGILVMVRGNSSMAGGASYIIMSVASMGMSVGVSVYSIFKDIKDREKKLKERSKAYEEYITAKRNEIRYMRDQEAKLLDDTYYTQSKTLEFIRRFDGRLFDRSVYDEDFLHVRLGSGSRDSAQDVSYKNQERVEAVDKLQQIPAMVQQEFKKISDAPITLKLNGTKLVGIVGNREALAQEFKRMSLDLSVRHHESDLKMFYCINEEDVRQFPWIRRLPHVQNEAIGCRNIICDDESRRILLEYLYKMISSRDEKHTDPRVVVFLYRDWGIRSHPIFALMENGSYLGLTFLYFDEYEENLPHNCEYIVRMQECSKGTCLQRTDKTGEQTFTAEELSDLEMEYAAHRLQPVQCEEISLESTLTKNISFFELLGVYGPEDIDLSKTWKESQVYRSMAVPLGVKSKNQVVYLDLHEKAHGPHGLVAGTTGSGKSEVIQSYILSMALKFHPNDIGFVLIDFKGGGMANQFQSLPHLIGTMTNIDGREIERSLMSIRAELKKRQELFAQFGVNHIDAYIKLFKMGKAVIPLPHLILIVDEFAELKAEHPDFMKELVSAARIGRSLGVHLILATQKPSGVVDPQIWSNSRFKLCLKVQSKEDSNEVIKSPVAAEIKEPGRAYLQVGNNEIFELFQSGYSGGPAKIEGLTTKKTFAISKVNFYGKRSLAYERRTSRREETQETQLESTIRYIAGFAKKNGIQRLPMICLPPLPEILTYPETENRESRIGKRNIQYGLVADVGLYDDPSRQYQGTLSINVTQDNTIIIGSAQYGKTNMLQTIVRSLAEKYSPSEVNLYIMDFGTMIFRNFEGLRHVGGVVCANEDEKVKNLIRMLEMEIDNRKEVLAKAQVGSYAAYLEAGLTELPQIVVLIDNLTALRELYFNDTDPLLPLCRDGLGVGISFIIANSTTSGFGYKYLSNFGKRIALYCNDSSMYSTLFDNALLKLHVSIPGRCLIEQEKQKYEAQIWIAFEGEREIDRVDQIKAFVCKMNIISGSQTAKKIPSIPDILSVELMENEYISGAVSNNAGFYIGLDYDMARPYFMAWDQIGYIGLSGSDDITRKGFTVYLMHALARANAMVYILDDRKGVLSYAKNVQSTVFYSSNPIDIEVMFEKVDAEIKQRLLSIDIPEATNAKEVCPLVILVQSAEAIARISSSSTMLEKFKDYQRVFRDVRVAVIFTNLENRKITYSDPAVWKLMNDNRHFAMFEKPAQVRLWDLSLSDKKVLSGRKAGDMILNWEGKLVNIKPIIMGKEGEHLC